MSTHLLPTLLACALLAPIAAAAPGDRDPAFGNGGVVNTVKGNFSTFTAQSMAIQADGKIVAVGDTYGGSGWGVARFLQNGALDPTFHGKGKFHTVIPFPSDRGAVHNLPRLADPLDLSGPYALGIAIQADGKIVVVGSSDFYSLFIIARYTSAGYPDTSFGNNGLVITQTGGQSKGSASCVAIQRDGRIVVGGKFSQGSYISFVVVRYQANGQLDPSFGGDGIATVSGFGRLRTCTGVAIQANGKILVVGDADIAEDTLAHALVLARLNPDGTLDPIFGGTGIVTTNTFPASYDYAAGIAINRTGIYVAGTAVGVEKTAAFLLRYTHTGLLDASFNGNGKVISGFGLRRHDSGTCLALQSNGKILLGGATNSSDGINYDFTLSRYTPDGVLDSSFGHYGKARTDFSGQFFSYDEPTALAIAPDGKIVIGGSVVFYPPNAYRQHTGLVRYLGDPLP